jgi:tetratricopeptide (TPR) repeat protein
MGSSGASSRRYVIKEIIGQGGMGVVYRAYDNETRRDVTLKTLLDVSSPAMLELFRKECEVLSRLNHPNIVDIYDIGELLDPEGKRQPYFVMPLLPGVTLDRLIANNSHRLTVERAVEIISQACRGLHAAHERGLVHRDIKPSNIFVLEDDSVKLIDFGVAHLAAGHSQTSVKGTLHYMSPEQLQAKKPTPASDLFSLGVVCYQVLARRKPFDGSSADEVVEAILHQNPPPVSELNPAVNRTVSQVVQKSLAKHPLHRFSSMREFADNLQKAVRGETIELFDESRMLARIERTRKALIARELEFAGEILGGLEAEGYSHPELAGLRQEIDRALQDKTIGQLLESARRCVREDEYQLALQKIQEILQIEPRQSDALTLQTEIENRRSTEQIGKWMALAQQHLDNNAYNHARQALEDVLEMKPDYAQARKMLSMVEFREAEYVRVRKEKENHYQAAMEAWRKGEVSVALSQLERVMTLVRQSPDTSDPNRASRYQSFYNQVRSDHDALQGAYEDARKRLTDRDFKAALALCEEHLAKYPVHALFQALKVDVEEAQRQDLSAFIARIDREVEAEPDLDRRVSILREALATHPAESHFERALQLTSSKRDLVASIVGKARGYEERRQFTEALNQWEMLRTIYANYPGLSFEVERLVKRRDQQARADAKARWVQQIDQSLGLLEWQRAGDLVHGALAEFPEDGELKALGQLAEQGHERAARVMALIETGNALCAQGQIDEGIETLRSAYQLDDSNALARSALIEATLSKARASLETDPATANQLTTQALELEPSNALAKTLRALLDDRKRDREVDECLSQARQLQAAGELDKALEAVNKGLASHPRQDRLVQLKTSLERSLTDHQRTAARRHDLEEVQSLEAKGRQVADSGELRAMLEHSIQIARPYGSDKDFDSIVDFLKARLAAVSRPSTPPEPARAASAGIVEAPFVPQGAPAVRPELLSPPSGPAAASPPDLPLAGPLASLRRLSPAMWAASTLALGLVAFGAYRVMRHNSGPAAGSVPFQLTTEPSGAAVTVDGQALGKAPIELALAPGAHVALLVAPGYKTLERRWNVVRGFRLSQPERLEALAAHLLVNSELPGATLELDGESRTAPAPGAPFDLPELPLNTTHKLVLMVAKSTLEISFQASPARMPEVQFPQGPLAQPIFVLSTFGSRGRFYSSARVKLSFDGGKSYRDAGPEGLDLDEIPTDGVLSVEGGTGPARTVVVAIDSAPALQAFLVSSAPPTALGSLSIDSNESDFVVLVDRKKLPYARKGPPYLVYNVPVGSHQVQLQKPGYRTDPESLPANVQMNRSTAVKFSLIAVPATLAMEGALTGTRVSSGGRVLGVTDSGGELRIELPAGSYTVALSKDGYKPRTISQELSRGTQWTIGPPQSRLELLTGKLVFQKNRPSRGVSLRIQQTAGIPMNIPSVYEEVPSELVLPAGRYNLVFEAQGYKQDTATVGLIDSQVLTIPVQLDRH